MESIGSRARTERLRVKRALTSALGGFDVTKDGPGKKSAPSVKVLGVIGCGCFGDVFKVRARWPKGKDSNEGRTSDEILAMKRVSAKRRSSMRELALLREVAERARHREGANVTKLRTHFSLGGSLFLIMEYVPHGTLFDELQRHERGLPPLCCNRLSESLLRGLDFLHSVCGVCHRDIKPSNLLLSAFDSIGWTELKICDFGSARLTEDLIDSSSLSPYACSRFYRAPELLLCCSHHGCPVDLWAAACVVAEMWSGRVLLAGVEGTGDQLSSVCDLLSAPTDEDVSDLLSLGADSKLVELVLASHQNDVHSPTRTLTDKLKVEMGRDASEPDDRVYGLLSVLLTYSPLRRMSAAEALQEFCQT